MKNNISDRIYTYRGKIHRSTNEKLLSKEQLVKRVLSIKNLIAVSGTSVDLADASTPLDNETIEFTDDDVPNHRILKRAVPVNPSEITNQNESYQFELEPVANIVALAAESDVSPTDKVHYLNKC